MMTLVWTEQEDALLRELVNQHGFKWATICTSFPGKNSKQCRRRWTNHLSMNAKATEWTKEEDDQLIDYHKQLGNKWMEISRLFGDRTDNACKNRWHALCRKFPHLALQESPMTIVGVKHGTRTRQKIQEMYSGMTTSEDVSLRAPKRRRGNNNSKSGGSGSAATDSDFVPSGGAGATTGRGRSRMGPPASRAPGQQQQQQTYSRNTSNRSGGGSGHAYVGDTPFAAAAYNPFGVAANAAAAAAAGGRRDAGGNPMDRGFSFGVSNLPLNSADGISGLNAAAAAGFFPGFNDSFRDLFSSFRSTGAAGEQQLQDILAMMNASFPHGNGAAAAAAGSNGGRGGGRGAGSRRGGAVAATNNNHDSPLPPTGNQRTMLAELVHRAFSLSGANPDTLPGIDDLNLLKGSFGSAGGSGGGAPAGSAAAAKAAANGGAGAPIPVSGSNNGHTGLGLSLANLGSTGVGGLSFPASFGRQTSIERLLRAFSGQLGGGGGGGGGAGFGSLAHAASQRMDPLGRTRSAAGGGGGPDGAGANQHINAPNAWELAAAAAIAAVDGSGDGAGGSGKASREKDGSNDLSGGGAAATGGVLTRRQSTRGAATAHQLLTAGSWQGLFALPLGDGGGSGGSGGGDTDPQSLFTQDDIDLLVEILAAQQGSGGGGSGGGGTAPGGGSGEKAAGGKGATLVKKGSLRTRKE